MDWQVAILILGIVGSFVGIAAGVVQVVDYAEKRRETRKQAQDGASMTAAPAEPARPARPEEATPKAPTNNLPAPATPLVGREKEVAAITRLIAREPVRLVTLTGLGGIGKTRIAIQAASDLLPVFPSGAYFVDLEPINDPALVTSTIAQVLGVKEAAGWSLLDSLKSYLRDKQTLLVLDNFEQVVEAAPVLSGLLSAAPDLKAMVTSRMGLGIAGEHEFSVPPLELPNLETPLSPEQLLQNEAVALFVQRARAVNPDFALTEDNAMAVAEICSRLDGLPLAIELAAARSKLLTPQAILERLGSRLKLLTGPLASSRGGAAGRQQTLRETIDWSYDLLDPGAKTLFSRISVFTGGCTLDAVEAVCNADGALELDALDEMEALVDKSLLHRPRQDPKGGDLRFTMLETIREYALECLEGSGGAADIRRQHALYCTSLAERAEPELQGPRQVAWMDRLEEEHDNIRATLEWSEQTKGEAETGLRLAGALLWFWQTRGYITEGRTRLARLLALPGTEQSAARGHALIVAGRLAFLQGDYQPARANFSESLEIYRKLNDNLGCAHALTGLGSAASGQGDYATSRTLFEESLSMYRQANADKGNIAVALSGLGSATLRLGDYEQASTTLNESLALYEEVGNKQGAAFMLAELGDAALAGGDYAKAQELLERSLALRRELGHKLGIANSLLGLAEVATARDKPEQAARLLGASQALFDAVGYRMEHSVASRYDKTRAEAREKLDEGVFNAAYEEGRTDPEELAVGATA